MTRDLAWSPHEVKALREVQHLSQRSFAEHLGFAQSTVANWEKATRDGTLHHETREVLNRELARLPTEQRERFDRRCSIPPGKLGVGSATRTRHIIDSLDDVVSPLPYHVPTSAVEAFHSFLSSTARVFLLEGPAGTGKTQLTRHLANQFENDADLQILTATEGLAKHTELASEMLRYASIHPGQDALLTLEEHGLGISRPCVAVIDGIANDHDFAFIGRQVEAILRQVTTPNLRFLIVVRTPLAVETTAYPLIYTNIYTPTKSLSNRNSVQLGQWSPAEARLLWDQARAEQTPPYDQLPSGIQNLTRTPVYLQLALAASLQSPRGDLNGYALLEQCVRTITGNDVTTLSLLTDHAYRQHREELPDTMPKTPPGLTRVTASHDTRLPTHVTKNIARPHNDQLEFTHDILREFFVSTAVADYLHAQGRGLSSVRTLNDLAERAGTSGITRNIIELVFQRLDNIAPDVLAYVATAPATSAGSTLPLLMAVADDGRFATPELLRQVVHRAEREPSLGLCRSLLHVHSVTTALGPDLAAWIVALLRRFGTALWPDIARFIEHTFGTAEARDLIEATDLTAGDEAIFIARHFYLVSTATDRLHLDSFLGHSNWRVRAALAEGISDDRAPQDVSTLKVLEQLIHDPDYKVRAAAARASTRLAAPAAQRHIVSLLHDDNWHVRELVLRNLDQQAASYPSDTLAQTALATTDADPSWQHCPHHVQPSWHRLRILLGSDPSPGPVDDHRALLSLLREVRTGYLTLSATRVRAIVDRAQRSGHRLVRQEADQLAAEIDHHDATSTALRNHERFRRTRGARAVQIALDVHDVEQAVGIAEAAVKAGAEFVEIGDPLIKQAGVSAIEQVKTAVPDATMVAEMMSADWGRDQVLLAVEAGADVVLLIGPATTASVSAAVDAGQRLGVPVLLDAPTDATRQWVGDMERAGVDGFAITTNIDVGIGSATAFETAQTLRSWTRLPVAVSGGFSAADHSQLTSADWDILIVGRSVTDAVDPVTAAAHIVELTHQTGGHA